MKRERIISVSLEDETEGRTDWKGLEQMTEEEIHKAALSDPDAQPTHPEDWDDAAVIQPGERLGRRGPKPSPSKNVEVKVRFRSLDEKQRVLRFIADRYPELSITSFVRMAVREKIEREKS
jgi:hypothetical protein